VLAGDPRQLPPTVIDSDAERLGLRTTYFERLARVAGPTAPVRMLVVQPRMHETLMTFPSQSQYDGKLVAAHSVTAHTLPDLGNKLPFFS